MNLSALAGNSPLKRQISAQTDGRGLSHAYILSGPVGSGRHTLAALLSTALVCTRQGAFFPCGLCAGCRKAAAGIHPDLIRVGTDGKDITVAQIRALRSDAYIRPNEAERKVYVLEHAQTMNASAQNAILKLLEEGPAYAAFLLITDNAGSLLPTVRSRCEHLALTPVSLEEGEAYLSHRFPDTSSQDRRQAVLACEGLLGQAVALLDGSPHDTVVHETALQFLSHLSAPNELSLLELCVSLEKWDRDKLCALLDELRFLLRDLLVSQLGALVSDPLRQKGLSSVETTLTKKELLSAVATVQRLRTACSYNVGTGHLVGWLSAALSSDHF